MDTLSIQVQMMGGFVLRREGTEIPVSGRSRKLCQLLAVLIWERNRSVPCGELIELLWSGEPQDARSLNALKAILHRARVSLAQLEETAGQPLILNRGSRFQWNPQVPLTVDAEDFSRLCREAEQASEEDRKLTLGLEALALYQGDFLPTLEDRPWAEDIRRSLRQQYVQTVPWVLSLLEDGARWQETARTAEAALALDPLREDLCARQMAALLRLERRREAVQLYEAFQDRLLSRLGVPPSGELRDLCRAARQDPDPRLLTPDTLLEQLAEEPQSGALLCGFDFFRVLCHASARRAGRDGTPVHSALFSLSGPENRPLPRHSLDRAMGHLQSLLVGLLRRGDAVCRYGASQFVILLPQAGPEDSRMVCHRITRAFQRQFPHSPAVISVSVQPLALGPGRGEARKNP